MRLGTLGAQNKIIALGLCLASRSKKRGGAPLALMPEPAQAQVRRQAAAGARRAAVLVPIASVDGVPSVVLSVRSMLVPQPGQVSFPGGHSEEGETALETAFREAEEELGLAFRTGFEVVDTCSEVMSPSGVVVTPVVATRTRELDLNEVEMSEEVGDVFALSVPHLLDPENREVRTYEGRGTMPVFHGGPEEVWGLTAYILSGVLDELIAPCWLEICDAEAAAAARDVGIDDADGTNAVQQSRL